MTITIRVLAAGVLASALSALPAMATERVVTGGIVHGVDLPDGGTLFRGMPYAQPPVGALRWKPPAPVIPWQGVRDATLPGPPCLQRSYEWNAPDAAASKEDCLYLAVRSPKHAPMDRLPVMFWIHGGANRAGSGIGYSTSDIDKRGIVLVTLQYRLGIFGFLSLPALTAESPAHASGNYALMDQIAALKWVKANIANFGGDPNNVTIFGQSAGAQDVGLLMLSPLAKGLFNKAIEESGTAGFGVPPRTLAQNEKIGEDLAALMNVPPGADGLQALRAASGDALLDATDKLLPPIEDDSFIWLQAVVDGWVIPQTPAEIFARKGQARVPLVIGNNARELDLHGGLPAARHWITESFGRNAPKALAFYGLSGPDNPPDDPVLGDVATQIADDVTFRCPANFVAQHQQTIGQNVWRYQFDVAKADSDKPVWHSSELSYVFDAPPPGATWPPVQAYWTNFAKSGNPNGPGLRPWPQMGASGRYIEFTTHGAMIGQNLRGPLCRLLNNF
jgi:para-nitrobenzyl esterase